ncbi:MAG TPA: glycosyltransferase family 4 protein [Gemmatimonadales bacterium]|nr:glycosyltransferase family 4 protein [Gemmatimonadales bacterium]
MRVLHVTTAFPTRPDDVITPWLVELIKHLRARGTEVDVFTSAYRGLGDQVVEGIPVYRFRYFWRRWENLTHEETAPDRMRRSLLYRVLPFFFVLAGMVAIWRHCRRHRYDIVQVHWPLPLALFGWAADRARAVPIVTTFYGAELRLVKGSLPILKPFLAWAARRSARVVAISSYTASEVREIADVSIEIIPYTTPLPEPKGAVRGAGPILFVGRLVARKGVDRLIAAVARLGQGAPIVEIVGDGPERGALEDLARRLGLGARVQFRGKISAEALQESYARAAVAVLPAVVDARGDTEGLGVVLLEAMNSGIPVVASRVGGIPDIVEDGVSGLLVPPGDEAALADALGRLIRDPDLAARLGAAGRERVHTHFSWDAISARWEKLYAAVVSESSHGQRRSRSA